MTGLSGCEPHQELRVIDDAGQKEEEDAFKGTFIAPYNQNGTEAYMHCFSDVFVVESMLVSESEVRREDVEGFGVRIEPSNTAAKVSVSNFGPLPLHL